MAQAVTRGSLIYGNSPPKWDELTVGAANAVLTADGTDVAWSTTPTVATLTTTGAATIAGQLIISGAAAGQIVFPASQNASANANTIDDYEEGTWTPTIGGNATYTIQTGTYQRTGNHVNCEFHLQINVLGTGTQTMSGLPFTTAASQSGLCPYFDTIATNTYFVGFYTGSGNDTTVFTGQDALDGSVVNSLNVFQNSAQVLGACHYRI